MPRLRTVSVDRWLLLKFGLTFDVVFIPQCAVAIFWAPLTCTVEVCRVQDLNGEKVSVDCVCEWRPEMCGCLRVCVFVCLCVALFVQLLECRMRCVCMV